MTRQGGLTFQPTPAGSQYPPIYLRLINGHFAAVFLSVAGLPFVPAQHPILASVLLSRLPSLLFRGGSGRANKRTRFGEAASSTEDSDRLFFGSPDSVETPVNPDVHTALDVEDFHLALEEGNARH
eukprot:11971963-Heterocapsa_arctica.AAC.1